MYLNNLFSRFFACNLWLFLFIVFFFLFVNIFYINIFKIFLMKGVGKGVFNYRKHLIIISLMN